MYCQLGLQLYLIKCLKKLSIIKLHISFYLLVDLDRFVCLDLCQIVEICKIDQSIDELNEIEDF